MNVDLSSPNELSDFDYAYVKNRYLFDAAVGFHHLNATNHLNIIDEANDVRYINDREN